MATGLNDATEVDVVVDLEAVFRAHYGRLVRALTLVAGSSDLAADAVQEAFIKAHLHWRRVQQYDDPAGWIRRVAINKLRDEHRWVGRKRRVVERIVAMTPPPTSLDPAVTAAGHDADLTAQLLQSLPRQQRLAMALFYVDELSVTEVAAAMNISEGAVKFHLHQGRQRLRAAVESGETA